MTGGIADVFCHDCVPSILSWEVFPRLTIITNALNPFIYFATESRFRNHLLLLLRIRKGTKDASSVNTFTSGMWTTCVFYNDTLLDNIMHPLKRIRNCRLHFTQGGLEGQNWCLLVRSALFSYGDTYVSWFCNIYLYLNGHERNQKHLDSEEFYMWVFWVNVTWHSRIFWNYFHWFSVVLYASLWQ